MSAHLAAVGKIAYGIRGWIFDMCWLLKNVRKVRRLAEAGEAPLCPRCKIAMEFQSQEPRRGGWDKYYRNYKCPKCGLPQLQIWPPELS